MIYMRLFFYWVCGLSLALTLCAEAGWASGKAARDTSINTDALMERAVSSRALWHDLTRAALLKPIALSALSGTGRRPALYSQDIEDGLQKLDMLQPRLYVAALRLGERRAAKQGSPWRDVLAVPIESLKGLGTNWPPTVPVYQFRHGTTLVIAFQAQNPTYQADPKAFMHHELREAYWLSKGLSRRDAHIVASAEVPLAFSLSQFSLEELDRLAEETREQRAYQHAVLKKWENQSTYALRSALIRERLFYAAVLDERKRHRLQIMYRLVSKYAVKGAVPIAEMTHALGFKGDGAGRASLEWLDYLNAANPMKLHFTADIHDTIVFVRTLHYRAQKKLLAGVETLHEVSQKEAAYDLGVSVAELPSAVHELNNDPSLLFYLRLKENSLLIEPLRNERVRAAARRWARRLHEKIAQYDALIQQTSLGAEVRATLLAITQELFALIPEAGAHPHFHSIIEKEDAFLWWNLIHNINNILQTPLSCLNDSRRTAEMHGILRNVPAKIRAVFVFFSTLPRVTAINRRILLFGEFPAQVSVWKQNDVLAPALTIEGTPTARALLEEVADTTAQHTADLRAFRVYGPHQLPLDETAFIYPNDRLRVYVGPIASDLLASQAATRDDLIGLHEKSISQLEQLVEDLSQWPDLPANDAYLTAAREELDYRRTATHAHHPAQSAA